MTDLEVIGPSDERSSTRCVRVEQTRDDASFEVTLGDRSYVKAVGVNNVNCADSS